MNAPKAGWYGKVSSLGDFAHRRLPAEWIDTCDAWLSSALSGAKTDLGTRWLDVYLTAPILRFAWGPGIVDRHWWLGVLMPSCDNVGRYFPLVITQSRPQPPADRIALDHLELWYAELSRIAMATLDDDGGTVDAIEAAIEHLPPWPTARSAPETMIEVDPGAFRLESTTTSDLTRLVGGWATHEVETRMAGHSAWWTIDEASGRSRIELIEGLPDGVRFARLLANRN